MKKKIIVGIGVVFLIMLFLQDSDSSSSKTLNTSFTIPTPTPRQIDTQYNTPPANPSFGGLYFNGYPCTVDCSGHEAGYEWAEEHGITQDDVDNYSGNSNSFMEGMQSFVDDSE